jgi:hypothetical protein
MQPVSAGTTAYGLAWKVVSVMSVDGNVAIVRDQLSQTFKIDRTNLRYKGIPPQVGESWFVDRSLGNDWAFAQLVGTPLRPGPVYNVLTQADRDSIVRPEVNLTVYRDDTNTVEQWNGTAWTVLNPEPQSTRITINLTANQALATGNNTAQATWAWTVGDSYGNWIGNLSGTGDAYTTIPVSGRYQCDLHGNIPPQSGQVFACKIMKNGSVVGTNSFASDARVSVNTGEGTWVHAKNDVLFVAGDKIYWQFFSTAVVTMNAINLGVRTRLQLRRIGPN